MYLIKIYFDKVKKVSDYWYLNFFRDSNRIFKDNLLDCFIIWWSG